MTTWPSYPITVYLVLGHDGDCSCLFPYNRVAGSTRLDSLLLIEMRSVLILFPALLLVYSFQRLLAFLSAVRSIQCVFTTQSVLLTTSFIPEIIQDIVPSYPLVVHWGFSYLEFQSFARETTTFL